MCCFRAMGQAYRSRSRACFHAGLIEVVGKCPGSSKAGRCQVHRRSCRAGKRRPLWPAIGVDGGSIEPLQEVALVLEVVFPSPLDCSHHGFGHPCILRGVILANQSIQERRAGCRPCVALLLGSGGRSLRLRSWSRLPGVSGVGSQSSVGADEGLDGIIPLVLKEARRAALRGLRQEGAKRALRGTRALPWMVPRG